MPRMIAVLAALAAAIGGTQTALAVPVPQEMQTPAPSPAITGPTVVPEHTLARFSAANVSPKSAMLWRVAPADKVDRATTSKDRFEFTAPPGTYTVTLLVITIGDGGALDVADLSQTVRIGSVTPPAPPAPPAPPKPKDPAAAIGRIQFGNAGCTATVIEPRRKDGKWDILTAAHCTSAGVGSTGTMSLKDGRRLNVVVTRRDTRSDVCWLQTTSAELSDMPTAVLASELPPAGTAVWHQGYGVDKPGNRESGVVVGPTQSGQLEFKLSVSSGDSGGSIIRADTGEVVATVCCTTGMAQRVSMYGGHCLSARRLRPADSSSDDSTTVPEGI